MSETTAPTPEPIETPQPVFTEAEIAAAEAEATAQPTPSAEPEAAQVPLSRDAMRAKIFGTKPKSKEIEFMGVKLELRQPDLGTIIDSRENKVDQSIMVLLNYAYVPGTNDKVFEEADLEGIRELPFGDDMMRLSTAVAELTGADLEKLVKKIEDNTKSAGE